MNRIKFWLAAAMAAALPVLAHAAGAVEGGAKQATNQSAISMFVVFVCMTRGIAYWAAMQTKSAAQFYSAGGGITGFQNGIAIAGDYMSPHCFLAFPAWYKCRAMTA
jgi:cation/acetate symporter